MGYAVLAQVRPPGTTLMDPVKGHFLPRTSQKQASSSQTNPRIFVDRLREGTYAGHKSLLLFLHPVQTSLIERHSSFCWAHMQSLSPHHHKAPGAPTECSEVMHKWKFIFHLSFGTIETSVCGTTDGSLRLSFKAP